MRAAQQALEADGARTLRNEFFFSAPQLKRHPLDGEDNQHATDCLSWLGFVGVGSSRAAGPAQLVRRRPVRESRVCAPIDGRSESELREIATLQLRNVAITKRAPPPMTPHQRRTRLYLVIPLSLVLVCIVLLVTTAYPYNLFLW